MWSALLKTHFNAHMNCLRRALHFACDSWWFYSPPVRPTSRSQRPPWRCEVLQLLLLVNAYELQAGKSPTQKVIQLLQDMAAKGRAEKQAEQVADRSGGGFPRRRRDELARGRSSQGIDYVSTLSGFLVHVG